MRLTTPGRVRRRIAILAAAAMLAITSVTACGDNQTSGAAGSGDGKFAGSELVFVVGFGPGGNTDTQARILAPHISEKLGVNVRVENQPAAGGLIALNQLYARKGDVTRIGFFSGQGVIGSVLGGADGVEFKLEDFVVMPQPLPDDRVLSSGAVSGLKTMDDVIHGQNIKMATPGPGGNSYVDAVVLYDAFDINGEIVTGFEGASDAALALVRGDAQIRSASLKSTVPSLEDGTHNLLLVIGNERIKEYPDVPTVYDMNLDESKRAVMDAHVALGQMGLMIVAPPGLPDDQAALLQQTFTEVYDDPAVQDEFLKTTGDPISPYNTAEQVDDIVNGLVNSPQQYKDLLHTAFDVR